MHYESIPKSELLELESDIVGFNIKVKWYVFYYCIGPIGEVVVASSL